MSCWAARKLAGPRSRRLAQTALIGPYIYLNNYLGQKKRAYKWTCEDGILSLSQQKALPVILNIARGKLLKCIDRTMQREKPRHFYTALEKW